jgi:hypothetical protein
MLPLVFGLAVQQTQSTVDLGIPACSTARCRGKRIAHTWGLFRFCIPHGMKFRRVTGFEGDVHDSIRLQSRGETGELIIFTANATWGPVKSIPEWLHLASPREASVRRWRCSEGEGQDFRWTENGRSWRMLGFVIGFAEYQNVSADIAAKFDRVLDSLCCEPLQP